MTVSINLFSHIIPVAQILALNGLSVAAVLWIYLQFVDGTGVVIKSPLGHVCRGLLFAIASFAFVISLKHLTFAQTVCIAFAGPLFMTVMARQFLGEQVGIHRVLAVVAGFIGVVIIIDPGASDFRWIMLLPLVVALGDAARDIITRKIAPGESTFSIVFTSSLIIGLVALVISLPNLQPVQLIHLPRFGVSLVATIIAYSFMVEAYRHAPASLIAPFRYVQIIWTILAGIIIWQEFPAMNVYLGTSLTVGAGIYIVWRETRRQPV